MNLVLSPNLLYLSFVGLSITKIIDHRLVLLSIGISVLVSIGRPTAHKTSEMGQHLLSEPVNLENYRKLPKLYCKIKKLQRASLSINTTGPSRFLSAISSTQLSISLSYYPNGGDCV